MTIRSLEAITRRVPSLSDARHYWADGHLFGFSRHTHHPRRSTLLWAAGGFLAGATVLYFLDPDRGARRRHITRDRLVSVLRRTGSQLERFGHRVGSDAYGLSQKAMHPGFVQSQPANDADLAHKVETELFRSRRVPKGRINVNAEEGVVVLRGELDRPDEIKELVAAAGRIPGVRAVENLLHLPHTPTRNSAAAHSGD
jgi:BON domain